MNEISTFEKWFYCFSFFILYQWTQWQNDIYNQKTNQIAAYLLVFGYFCPIFCQYYYL